MYQAAGQGMKAGTGLTGCLVLVLLVASLASLAACSGVPVTDLEGPHDDLGVLMGRLLGGDEVVVVPNRRWSSDEAGWAFRHRASLVCHVAVLPEQPLVVVFEPDEVTRRFHFSVHWDGIQLDDGARPAGASLQIEIPAASLTPGVHMLGLRRKHSLEDAADRRLPDNRFASLSFGLGRAARGLPVSEHPLYQYLASFLTKSVTGLTRRKAAGCLVRGPRTIRLQLAVDGEAAACFRVENASSEPARFAVTVDSQRVVRDVAPQSNAPLELALPEGRSRITLRVDGAADGLFLWGAPHLAAQAGNAPPVVLLTLDTTRRDALSPYGGDDRVTPNLQRLADQATVFTNAHATSPWTLPSHASIFTGLYPFEHRAGTVESTLGAEPPTLATMLAAEGYFTLGLAGGELCASRWGMARGFAWYHDPDGFETAGDALTVDALEMLKAVASRRFFLFVNYFDPHALYRAPERFENLFGVHRLREQVRHRPVWAELLAGSTDAWAKIIDGETGDDPEGREYLRAAYLAEVAFMDEQIGRLLDALESEGLFDKALIVVMGDHGELLGEGGFYSHACRLDSELIEVPLIIKWPYQTVPRRRDELVSQVDVAGTVLAAVGLTPPEGSGVVLAEHPDGAPAPGREVYMEEHNTWFHPLFEHMAIAEHLYGVQGDGRRELVWDGGSSCERLVAGRWQEVECGFAWQERLAELAAFRAETGTRSEPDDRLSLTEEDADRLRALGYVR